MAQFILIITILLIIIIFIQKGLYSIKDYNGNSQNNESNYKLTYSDSFPLPNMNDKYFFIHTKNNITSGTKEDNFYELLFPGRNNLETCSSTPGGGSAETNN